MNFDQLDAYEAYTTLTHNERRVFGLIVTYGSPLCATYAGMTGMLGLDKQNNQGNVRKALLSLIERGMVEVVSPRTYGASEDWEYQLVESRYRRKRGNLTAYNIRNSDAFGASE